MRPWETSQYQNCSSPGRTSSRSGTKNPPDVCVCWLVSWGQSVHRPSTIEHWVGVFNMRFNQLNKKIDQ